MTRITPPYYAHVYNFFNLNFQDSVTGWDAVAVTETAEVRAWLGCWDVDLAIYELRHVHCVHATHAILIILNHNITYQFKFIS